MAIIAGIGVVRRRLFVRTVASPRRMRSRSTISAVIPSRAIVSSVADQGGPSWVDEVGMLGLWVSIARRSFSGTLWLLPRSFLSVIL